MSLSVSCFWFDLGIAADRSGGQKGKARAVDSDQVGFDKEARLMIRAMKIVTKSLMRMTKKMIIVQLRKLHLKRNELQMGQGRESRPTVPHPRSNASKHQQQPMEIQ